jgi:hypothetical protein
VCNSLAHGSTEKINFRTAKPAVFVLCALLICAYFLALAGQGLTAGFVNLTTYANQPMAALAFLVAVGADVVQLWLGRASMQLYLPSL